MSRRLSLVLFALTMALAAAWPSSALANEPTIAHKACSHPVLPMPRTFSIHPGTPQASAIRAGFATVARESGYRVRFQELPYGAEVDSYVLPSSTYWIGETKVDIPCGRIESVFYVGTDADMSVWAPHEIMHTIGFPDYIEDWRDGYWFTNPGRCPSSGYVGSLSYCASRSQWWSADDDVTFWWWF